MTNFNRRFTPSWWAIILAFAGISLFVSLGLWQLDRAAFKEAIKIKFETHLDAEYRQFDARESLSELDLTEIEFQKLIMRGQYDLSRTILIDNQLHRGQAGYHVLSPFTLNGVDKIVLVNRGWLALGESREQLPVIKVPPVDGLIRGIVSIPNTGGFRMGEISLNDKWPQVIPFIDIEAMQSQFQNRLLPLIIWLDSEQTGHYQRLWNPVWANPDKSRAYAWQWFAFALVTLVLFVGLNLRRVSNE